MADETQVSEGEIESSSGGVGDALAAFVNDDDGGEEAKPEPKAKPKAEAKPERKPERQAKAQTEEEGEEEEEKPKAKAEEKPPEKRTYKHKVLGEERELDAEEIDRAAKALGVEAKDLLSASSLKRASYERMSEAAQMRKQVEEAQKLAKTDPAAALKLLGLDPAEYEKHAEQLIFNRYKSQFDPATGQPLTPEQKALAEERAKREELENRIANEEKTRKEAEETAAYEEAQKRWVQTIVGHLEKSGDPRSILPRVAQHLGDAVARDQGVDPAGLIEEAASLAWEDIQAEHGKLYDTMDYGSLKSRFPKLVEKVRKGLVDEYRQRSGARPAEEVPERPREAKRRRFTSTGDLMDDFVKHG